LLNREGKNGTTRRVGDQGGLRRCIGETGGGVPGEGETLQEDLILAGKKEPICGGEKMEHIEKKNERGNLEKTHNI